MSGSGYTLNDMGSVVSLNASRDPRRVAVELADSDWLTYQELDERSTRLANALRDGLGLAAGDSVAAWMEDAVQYVELYVAAAKANVVMVPINSRLTHHEAAYQLECTGARALFYTAGPQAQLEQLAMRDELTLVSVLAHGQRGRGACLEDLIADASATPRPAPAPEDPAMICFTSGTTGHPKGAVLSHRSAVTLAITQQSALRIPLYGVNIQAVSMTFPATVVSHLLAHFVAGGTQVLAPGKWDSDRILDLIARKRATHLYVPAPALSEFTAACLEQPSRIETLSSVLHAGSRADPNLLAALCDAVGTRYVEGWGMTEISGGLGAATTPTDVLDPPDDFFSSVGRPVPGTVVKAVDDERRRLPFDPDAVGELAIRSPSLFKGYWNDPEATAKVVSDGWYFTGDLGSVDERGYIRIADRAKNMIRSGGMNVYPAELELVLERCPGIAECAVVGAAHERWGQTPVIVAVPLAGATLTEDDIIGYAAEHLASYKKPTRVVFTDELPRTSGGKVVRAGVQTLVDELIPPASASPPAAR